MNIDKLNHERDKYVALYEDIPLKYGRYNHAKAAGLYDIILNLKLNSICDVGCGGGEFCEWASKTIKTVYGVDLASVRTNQVIKNGKIIYFDSDAGHIPLEDKSVEFVTCFDCLEHCPEEDIDEIFIEFKRVASKGFFFTIATWQTKILSLGEVLHLTVKPEIWWEKKIADVMKCRIKKIGHGTYLGIFE